MNEFVVFYIVIINIIGLIIIASDKKRAINKQWRVPEANLFFIAIILGSIGIFIGMYLFHHKTKHLKFVIGIPFILIVQILVIYKLSILMI